VDVALQLTLADPAQFQPLPLGPRHYVPALQTKKGELQALRVAPPTVWTRCTPLVEILGPRTPGNTPFSRARVEGWVKRVADAVGGHPIFLDRLRLAPNHVAESRHGRQPVLAAIYASATRRGLVFVPVSHLGEGPVTTERIAVAAAETGRGAALRVPLLGTVVPDGERLPTMVERAVAALDVGIRGVDLLMDLRQIPEDAELDIADLGSLIEELLKVGPWRNVVLLGTTMPRSLGGGVVEAGTTGRLPRKEWELWRELAQAKLGRPLTFGDYAIQHPEPPLEVKDGQIPLGLRGAIRYTHTSATVIPRAKAPRYEEGREQYRHLCQLLVQQPEFAGRDYTWGDQQIADCAEGRCHPGWEDHWRGAATSHHLRVVVDQIASLS